MTGDLDFGGNVVLVTGGSRGIGRAACIKFGRLGAKVAVGYRSSRAAAEAIVEDIEASGGEAIAVQADVSDARQVQAMVRAVIERFVQIDVLVNKAGGATGRGRTIMDTSDEDWELNLGV